MDKGKSHIKALMERYFDGLLNIEETDELFNLLNIGPSDLEYLVSGEFPPLCPGEINFPNKSTLHKTYSDITDAQFETLCIAEIEGDLSPSQSKEILSALESDSAKNKVYDSFKKLRLEPETVVYQDKQRLKKLTLAGQLARFSAVSLSMAATIAIIIIAFNFLNNSVEETLQTSIVAESESIEGTDSESAGITPDELLSRNSEPVIHTVVGIQKEAPVQIAVSAEGPQKIPMSNPVFLASDSPVSLPVIIQNRLAEITLNSPQAYQSPSLRENIAIIFRGRFLGDNDPSGTPLKGYEIAGAGINGLNKLLGWEMDLKARKEESGEVDALAFNSRLIKIQAPVKRGEPLEQ